MQTTAIRDHRSHAWILALALVACGAPSASPAGPAATPALEREVIVVNEGAPAQVDGRDAWLAGWNAPASEGAFFDAALRLADGSELTVGHPGCTRVGEWVWTLDELTTEQPARARFTRTRVVEAPRPIAWGEATRTTPAETLAGDGVLFRMGALRELNAAVWTLAMRADPAGSAREHERFEVALDVQRANAYEQRLTADYLATPSATDELDAYGCPVVELVMISPRAIVVDASSEREVELRAMASAQVGDTYFRYVGWGEMELASGEGVGLARIEVSGPDRVVTRSSVCHVREDCPLGEWMVRVTIASPERASLVVRRFE